METTVLMLFGIPGCGKSTFADQYVKEGYKKYSSDALRLELYHDETDQKHNGEVFQELHKRIRTSLKNGESCIYDATNLSRYNRLKFLEEINEIPCKKVCAIILTPVDRCIENDLSRKRHVGKKVIERLVKRCELPYWYEGWDEIIPVDPFGKEYRIPVEVMADFSQDNPHHTLTLGGHIDKAYEYCVKQGWNQSIVTAAKYHDCGKLYTKFFRKSRNSEEVIAHFYDHENYGAYLYLLEKCCGKKLSQDEFARELYIANLINWHMMPLTKWKTSPKLYEEDLSLIGEEMMGDLQKLHEADLQAH